MPVAPDHRERPERALALRKRLIFTRRRVGPSQIATVRRRFTLTLDQRTRNLTRRRLVLGFDDIIPYERCRATH